VEVVGAQPHGEREVLGPDLPDGVQGLEQEALAVAVAAAVGVGALVGEREKKLAAR